MFPGEMMPASYIEDRTAADDAARFAKLQQEAMRRAQEQQKATQAQQQQQRTPYTPQNLTQQLLSRQPMASPGSSGLMGNIFQGFVRAASASPSPSQSQCTTPTPAQSHTMQITVAEMERRMKEKERDAQVACMPWL
ncbi:hypothetical protein LTR62_008490 [Meristemomyces frigidus]|uniref:Uncharacterized protein n=1 Tax=Meristemomyces frigidus TaxID=1508187 RepID=A0AAN7YM67_9PEZI|nr:hypothetical protein LTR62_008490 [Meristemomyces frigidus]